MKNQRGITLAALVVTIIVMLMLSGISLTFIVGNNGIITRTKKAVATEQDAKRMEMISMAVVSAETDYWTAFSKDFSKTKEEFYSATNLNKYMDGDGEITEVTPETNYYLITYKPNNEEIEYKIKVTKNRKNNSNFKRKNRRNYCNRSKRLHREKSKL